MATVPFGDRLATQVPRTGVTVGLYPSSSPDYDLNVWRAASTQGVTQPTSSKFSELATLGVINGGAPVPYVDQLALSKTFWWYKVRSVRNNVATPSAFTTAVVAQPGILPTSAPGAIPWTGKPIMVAPRLSTTALPTVTGNSSGQIKTLVRGFAGFVLGDSTSKASVAVNAIGPFSTRQSVDFWSNLDLPIGVTITRFRARVKRASTSGDVAIARLVRAVGDAGSALITMTSTVNGWTTLTSSGLNFTVSSSQSWSAWINLWGKSALGQSALLGWVSADYVMGSLAHTR